MGITGRLIEEQAQAYAKEIGPEKFKRENELLASLPEEFENGRWDWDDLVWLVEDWKLESFPAGFSTFTDNNEADVREVIRKTVETDGVKSKLEILDDPNGLSGVAIPVASAILLFMDPSQYTVIDKRAWRVLSETGLLYNQPNYEPTIENYLLYLGTCRTLASEFGVELRTLDRALWVLGR